MNTAEKPPLHPVPPATEPAREPLTLQPTPPRAGLDQVKIANVITTGFNRLASERQQLEQPAGQVQPQAIDWTVPQLNVAAMQARSEGNQNFLLNAGVTIGLGGLFLGTVKMKAHPAAKILSGIAFAAWVINRLSKVTP